MGREPDWTIEMPGSEGRKFSEDQRKWLLDLERVVSELDRNSDIQQVLSRTSPIVLALYETGLSVTEIADNSLLRPHFVQMVVEGGSRK